MITNKGENFFFDYLAGRLPRWAGKMAVGIGQAGASKTDKDLEYHISDASIDIIVPDFYQQLIVIRGVVPSTLDCEIREIGIYFEPTPSIYRSIVRFDPAVEQFEGGTQVFDGAVGTTSISAVDGDVITYSSYPLLLGSVAASDEFRIALHKTAGIAGVVARFLVDENNYYTYTFAAEASEGSQILRAEKRNFVPTGYPDWQSIQQVIFEVQADIGTSLVLDDMRASARNSQQILLAREVLSTPIRTQAGQDTEIEYKVKVNFGN
jgi:hypothetical protein